MKGQPGKVTAGPKAKVTVRLDADLVKLGKIAAIQHDLDFQDLIAEGLALVIKAKKRSQVHG
jgi:hypothetical protein